MGRLFSFNMLTLDGFFAGPDGDISWHNVDEAFNDYATAQLNEIGTLLFGRVTYQLMASYWPTAEAIRNDPVVAGLMNGMPKVVFSRTLEKADWSNTRLVRDRSADEVQQMKRQSARDLAIFGSGNLLASLIELKLVDEQRVMLNPVILGRGLPLFTPKEQLHLKLIKTKAFGNGNVLLVYQAQDK